MNPLLVILPLLGGGSFAAQDAEEGGGADLSGLLAEGRYVEAYAALGQESDLVSRQEGLAKLYLAAEDPVGALGEVKRGLDAAPEHLELLRAGGRAAWWLASPSLLEQYSSRLVAAVDDAPELDDHLRAWYRDWARDFARHNAELIAVREARDTAVGRAQKTAAIGLFGAIAALVFLATRR